MALEDYFVDIVILSQLEKEANLVGGLNEDWQEIATVQGIVNKKTSQQSSIGGKANEETFSNGYFEITDDTTNYLIPENRVKYDSKIYKITGIPKNTINIGHHYKVELEYMNHIESS